MFSFKPLPHAVNLLKHKLETKCPTTCSAPGSLLTHFYADNY